MSTADRLEELQAPLKEIVQLLREGQPDDKAYALVYEFRRRLGHIVRQEFGAGVPGARVRQEARQIIDNQIQN